MPRPAWKSLRHRLEAAFCRLLAWGIPKLPRMACVRLSRALGSLAYTLDGRGRRVALANLECAFGSRYSPAERERIARASYHNFARTMLDLFWGQNLTRENWTKYLRIEGLAEFEARIAGNKNGLILLCAHYGNWEWALLLSGLKNYPLMVVAEPFKNPALTAIFDHLRQHTGCEVIAQEKSLLRMLRRVKGGGHTGMLLDLTLPPSQAATIVRTFATPEQPGLEMCVPLLHSVLAERAGTLLIPFAAESQPDGTCVVKVFPPVEHAPGATLQEITEACWKAMEPLVVAKPELWLWPYKHFRYAPKAAPRPYPFYAHPNGRFEKLRKEQLPAAPTASS